MNCCEEKPVKVVSEIKTSTHKNRVPITDIDELLKNDSYCFTNKIKYIGKVNGKLVVMVEDCIFYETSLDVIDLNSFKD